MEARRRERKHIEKEGEVGGMEKRREAYREGRRGWRHGEEGKCIEKEGEVEGKEKRREAYREGKRGWRHGEEKGSV